MAPIFDSHHMTQFSQCSCNIICHAVGLTILPVFMYYLSRLLRLILLGDTISQDEVNRDTAAIARIFACVNVFVVCAATVIYLLGRYETCGEFEIFIALLDVAMTASWVCVCLIPLELYCARRREEEAHGINREDGKQQLQASEKMSAKDKKDEKVPLLEDDTA